MKKIVLCGVWFCTLFFGVSTVWGSKPRFVNDRRFNELRDIVEGNLKDPEKLSAELMEAASDINVQHRGIGSILHYYASKKKVPVQILDIIIALGGDVHARDQDNDTPLFHAEGPAKIKCLVKNGACVDEESKPGYTPLLMNICGNGNLEDIETLIQLGANVNTKTSTTSPLMGALKWVKDPRFTLKFYKCVKLLVERGAKIGDKEIELADKIHDGKIMKKYLFGVVKKEKEKEKDKKSKVTILARLLPLSTSNDETLKKKKFFDCETNFKE